MNFLEQINNDELNSPEIIDILEFLWENYM